MSHPGSHNKVCNSMLQTGSTSPAIKSFSISTPDWGSAAVYLKYESTQGFAEIPDQAEALLGITFYYHKKIEIINILKHL